MCLVSSQVAPIVEKVRKDGDEAVKAYTAQFDRVQLQEVCVRIEVSRIAESFHISSDVNTNG